MSNESAKINLKIGQVEISIEGPPDFVSAQYDKVEAHLKTYSEMSTKIVQSDEDEGNQNNGNSSRVSDETLPETFGEWLNKIPNQTSDTQKAILAGYYVQKSSEDNSFRARDVNKILKDHSLKLSNSSVFLKNAADSKKLFQVSKTGKEPHYRVSRETEDTLVKLLKGQQVSE
jgi:hypothetical protein